MHPRTLHSTSDVDAHFHWKRLTLTPTLLGKLYDAGGASGGCATAPVAMIDLSLQSILCAGMCLGEVLRHKSQHRSTNDTEGGLGTMRST